MWIRAKNGNVIEIDDEEHAKRALADEHEVFDDNPKNKGAKPWKPADVEDDAASDSE